MNHSSLLTSEIIRRLIWSIENLLKVWMKEMNRNAKWAQWDKLTVEKVWKL